MKPSPRRRLFLPAIRPLPVWAMRDLMRRPAETLFLGLVLALIVTVSATALLLTQALSKTAERILAEAPSLVVRKIGPGGWQPIEETPAVSAALSVAGVLTARPRVWGVVNGPDGPVTAVGAGPQMAALESTPFRLPGRGEAVVGPGVTGGIEPELLLAGNVKKRFTIIGNFPPRAGIAAHDLVVLHPDDARHLLGLPEGYASDLAVFVYHEEEETAILPELSAAFDGPVRITPRSEAAGYYAAAFARRGGLSFLAIGSTLFSMFLIVWFITRERISRRHEIGLLKTFGWTTGNIVALQVYRALFIGLPAAALGILASWALVFAPGVQWPGYLLFGWETSAPALYLDTGGAITVLLEITALVLLPFFAAVLFPALRHAAAAPFDLIETGNS